MGKVQGDPNFRSFYEHFLSLKSEAVKDLNQLEEENDLGNIEYKLKFANLSLDRIQHRTTQMKFRLDVRKHVFIIFF